MTNSEGCVGQQVYFGRANGEKSLGEIVKVNRVQFKVKLLEARGTYRNHKVGGLWTVPPSLCCNANEGRPAHCTKPRRQPRSYRRYRRRHDWA